MRQKKRRPRRPNDLVFNKGSNDEFIFSVMGKNKDTWMNWFSILCKYKGGFKCRSQDVSWRGEAWVFVDSNKESIKELNKIIKWAMRAKQFIADRMEG